MISIFFITFYLVTDMLTKSPAHPPSGGEAIRFPNWITNLGFFFEKLIRILKCPKCPKFCPVFGNVPRISLS
jgi:hypothetical protein